MTDDNLPKTTFQKDPLKRTTVDIAEFVDIQTGRMLAPSEGNLVGLNGKKLMRETRLKLNEAMSEAARWWNKTGRFAMPDRPKDKKSDEYLGQFGMASGILLGYDWERLDKDEKINVLRAWWLNVGIPQFLGADVVKEERNKGVLH